MGRHRPLVRHDRDGRRWETVWEAPVGRPKRERRKRGRPRKNTTRDAQAWLHQQLTACLPPYRKKSAEEIWDELCSRVADPPDDANAPDRMRVAIQRFNRRVRRPERDVEVGPDGTIYIYLDEPEESELEAFQRRIAEWHREGG